MEDKIYGITFAICLSVIILAGLGAYLISKSQQKETELKAFAEIRCEWYAEVATSPIVVEKDGLYHYKGHKGQDTTAPVEKCVVIKYK